MEALRAETLVAIAAVESALALANRGIGAVDAKDGRDVVTTADLAVEGLLRSWLGPDVIGEERGGEAPAGGTHWLVDPICGTRNFASGTPLWCINVALVENGDVTIGVVGDPSTGEVLVTERGAGAWALAKGNQRRISTSSASRTVNVEDGKSAGTRRAEAARYIAAVVSADRWDFRSIGTTLALPYVAAGRMSAYVLFAISGVHSAAGSLLVTEAGGVLTDVDGAPWTLASPTMLAAADADLHAELLALARA